MLEVVRLYFNKVFGKKKKKKNLVIFLTRIWRNSGYEVAHLVVSLPIALPYPIDCAFDKGLEYMLPNILISLG